MIPLQGRLAMSTIGVEFFHPPIRNAHSLGDFYRLGKPNQDPVFVIGTGLDTNIPVFNDPISFSDFRGQSGDRFIELIETNNNTNTWWQWTQILSTGVIASPSTTSQSYNSNGTQAEWNAAFGPTNDNWVQVVTRDEMGTTFLEFVSSSISTNINITVDSVVERINSQKKKQGYNSPDGSGIRFCGLRLEKPDGTLVHQQRDSAVSLQSSAWVNTTISFNHTLNTNTDGTSFVLRHTADIFRNDDDAPHLNWQMTDRKITVKSV